MCVHEAKITQHYTPWGGIPFIPIPFPPTKTEELHKAIKRPDGALVWEKNASKRRDAHVLATVWGRWKVTESKPSAAKAKSDAKAIPK